MATAEDDPNDVRRRLWQVHRDMSSRLSEGMVEVEDPRLAFPYLLLRLAFAIERGRTQVRRADFASPRERSVIGALFEHGPLTMGDLAKRLALTPPAASAVVDKLESRGMVQRTVALGDRRRMEVSLLPAATVGVDGPAFEFYARLVEGLEGLDDEAVATVADVLRRAHGTVDELCNQLADLDHDELRVAAAEMEERHRLLDRAPV